MFDEEQNQEKIRRRHPRQRQERNGEATHGKVRATKNRTDAPDGLRPLSEQRPSRRKQLSREDVESYF